MCGPTGISGIKPQQLAAGVIGSQLLKKKKPDLVSLGGNVGWDGRPNGPGQMS